MPEIVTVTPGAGRRNSDGDPIEASTSFELIALEVAPGNTLVRYGVGGDLKSVEFTVFLPLRTRSADPETDGSYVSTVSRLTDTFTIEVRNKVCRGLVQEWNSGGAGGLVVLAHSATGKGA